VKSRTVRALGVLLLYPSDELRDALPEIEETLGAEADLSPATRADLGRLLDALRTMSPLDAEEVYVSLFDRGTRCSLHLLEHVHGDARERGAAMAALRDSYLGHGFEPVDDELPDHLPLVCEFASLVPEREARALLADAAPPLATLEARLAARASAYAAVPRALLELAGERIDRGLVAAARAAAAAESGPADDLEAIDSLWEEPEVSFGSCPSSAASLGRERLR
jgi:nitrate reductase delta subunit